MKTLLLGNSLIRGRDCQLWTIVECVGEEFEHVGTISILRDFPSSRVFVGILIKKQGALEAERYESIIRNICQDFGADHVLVEFNHVDGRGCVFRLTGGGDEARHE